MPIAALSLTRRVDALVRHPSLTRLQLVPQLTIVRSASPGGNHTRYEHSLGVMENVRRMLSTLLDEPSFLGVLGQDSIETGLVAALLYNAHRFPFSNIIHELNKRLPPGDDKVFETFARSNLLEEVFGEKFKSHKGLTLTELISETFPSVNLEKLNRILTSSNASRLEQPDEMALYTLLNSSLDARVVDFVRRDSLHLGLSSGDAFELEDLLPHLTIRPARTGSAINQVTLRPSGISVAEQIILMRYWLYQRVYWNQPNRAYNAAIRRALLDLVEIPGFENDFRASVLSFDESQLLNYLYASAEAAGLLSTAALLCLVKGTEKILYREVFSRSRRQCESDPVLQDADDLGTLISKTMSYETMRKYERNLAQIIAKRTKLISSTGAPLVLIDVPFEPGNIKLGADIFVATHSNSNFEGNDLRSLDSVSPIVAAVNSNFSDELQRLRILVRGDVPKEEQIGHILYAELRNQIQD
jgi:HD superfamily phosphohydrolase